MAQRVDSCPRRRHRADQGDRSDTARPHLAQSVRKVVQSPEILADKPAGADSRDGLLVLIGRRFTAGELVRSLNAFGIGGAVAIEAGATSANARRPIDVGRGAKGRPAEEPKLV
jgi:hypothetical protein